MVQKLPKRWFSAALGDEQEGQEVKMTKTKVLGLLLFLASNSYLAVSWQSWAVQVAGMYIVLSVAEYFLLLSAVERMPLIEHWM